MLRKFKFAAIHLFIIFGLGACSMEDNSAKSNAETEAEMISRALEIHDRVLTLDTHADTPLRMIQPGFDMAERHDPNRQAQS
jgi:hypothetical protein